MKPGSPESVEAARTLLGPSKVRLHHVPRWFSTAITRTFPAGKHRSTYAAIEDLRQLLPGGMVDHWGSTTMTHWYRDGLGSEQRVAFVLEPYGQSVADLQLAQRYADHIDVDLAVSPNSWWYPGATIRIAFMERVL